jgi:hypothetical protein
MIFKCHICGVGFDAIYVVYHETAGNPRCPVCGSYSTDMKPDHSLAAEIMSKVHKVSFKIDN